MARMPSIDRAGEVSKLRYNPVSIGRQGGRNDGGEAPVAAPEVDMRKIKGVDKITAKTCFNLRHIA